MIVLKNIKKEYEYKVLDGIDLTINSGDFIAITGKSGSGKTTLLNILGGLIDFEGEYFFKSIKVNELKDKSDFRKNIGYIFQEFYLENECSVYENVELPFIINKKKDYDTIIKSVLEYVGLGDKLNKKCSKLSGGERQRVCIARAIGICRDFIIADEPTGSLDSNSKRQIMELLKKLNNEGKTIILVTHDLDDASYANKIYELIDGKLYEKANI